MRFALDQVSLRPVDSPMETSGRTILKKTAKEMLESAYAESLAESRDGFVSMSLCGSSSSEGNEDVTRWVQRIRKAQHDEALSTSDRPSTSGTSTVPTDDENSLEPARHDRNRPSINTSLPDRAAPTGFNIMVKVAKTLISDGTKQYSLENWAQAGECFDSALAQVSNLSPDALALLDLNEVYFKLGSICLRKGELAKAEGHFQTLVMDEDSDDLELALLCYLKLGEVCLAKNDLDEALKFSEKAANGFADKWGDSSEQHYDAVSLMAKVYDQLGDRLLAEALRKGLPAQHQEQASVSLPRPSTQPPRHNTFEVEPKIRKPKPFAAFRSKTSRDLRSPTKAHPTATDSSTTEVSSTRRRLSMPSSVIVSSSSNEQDPLSTLESWGFAGDFDANKALHQAIKEGSDRTVNMLLQGRTFRARRKFYFQEQSLEKKADPNDFPKGSPSPLMLAITEGKVTIARSLMDHGAIADRVDGKGQTPLLLASKLGLAEIVRLFRPDAIKAACDTVRRVNPLHVANDTEVLRILLNSGANPNACDSFGQTALKLAAGKGHADAVSLLLSYHADPSISDDHSNTPLMSAAREGRTACISLLVASTSCLSVLDAQNHKGETALFIAAKENYSSDAMMLMAAGADLEKADLHAWTPLIAACHNGSIQLVECLLEAGANYNAMSKSGSTCLDHAQVKKHRIVERLLKDRTPMARTGSRALHTLAGDKSNPFHGYTGGF